MVLLYLKLVNGDEVIAETIDENKDYLLSNPLMIQNVLDESQGTSAIVLVDYVPFIKNKSAIKINKNQIVSQCVVEDEMKEYYKASLNYSNLFGSNEVMNKIKNATVFLKQHIENKLQSSIPSSRDSRVTEDFEYFEEEYEDLDDELLDEITSSNTTFH